MLRRSFLQRAVASPLPALFPFIGKWRSQQPQDEVKPVEPTSRFHVFIPARTRATHEELRRIAYCAALEIAAYEHANEDCHLDSDRVRDCRLKYIQNENRAIHKALLVGLDSLRGNGKVCPAGFPLRLSACMAHATSARLFGSSSPAENYRYMTSMELKQACFNQYGPASQPSRLLRGECTFRIAWYDKQEDIGESGVYHIDVPEQATAAIKHINGIGAGCSEDSDLRKMCEQFRNGIDICTHGLEDYLFIPFTS